MRIRQHTVKEKGNFSQNALIGGSRSGRHLLQIPEKLSVLSWKSWCLAMEALGRIRLVVDGTQAAAGQREQSTSTYPINTRYDLHYSIATELGPNRSAARTPKQTHEEDKVEKCEARASHRRIRSGVSRIAPQPRPAQSIQHHVARSFSEQKHCGLDGNRRGGESLLRSVPSGGCVHVTTLVTLDGS